MLQHEMGNVWATSDDEYEYLADVELSFCVCAIVVMEKLFSFFYHGLSATLSNQLNYVNGISTAHRYRLHAIITSLFPCK